MTAGTATHHATTAPPRLATIVLPFRLGETGLEVAHLRAEDEDRLLLALPGPGELIDDTALRASQDWLEQPPQYIEQLYTFDSRPGTMREVIVSYLALFRRSDCEPSPRTGMVWSSTEDIVLANDLHRMVFDYGLVRLKAKFGYTNIAFHLLPETFALSDLQLAYEEVLGHAVDKRNFRRRMASSTILERTGDLRRDGSHRPAALYRFAARDDQAAYLVPSWAIASAPVAHRSDD